MSEVDCGRCQGRQTVADESKTPRGSFCVREDGVVAIVDGGTDVRYDLRTGIMLRLLSYEIY